MSDRRKAKHKSDPRGRTSPNPWRLPLRGWKEALLRALQQIPKDNIFIVGAGVAFYAFLSLFPLLIAVLSIYGLLASPAEATQQINQFADALPREAQTLIEEQVQRLTSRTSDNLTWGLALGVVVAIWSASRAVKNMMIALNIAYNEGEGRNLLMQTVVGLWLTFLIILALVIALGFIVVVPPFLSELPIGSLGKRFVALSRWPLLLVVALTIIGMLYRWGPNRADARVSWLSPGAVFASVSWLLASWAFSFFVSRFGNFGETYGSLAAVIILLLWFMLSATLVLIGAEINGELERQTRRDSTTGEPKPMGERGAYVADTLGGVKEDEKGDDNENSNPRSSREGERGKRERR